MHKEGFGSKIGIYKHEEAGAMKAVKEKRRFNYMMVILLVALWAILILGRHWLGISRVLPSLGKLLGK